MLVESSVDLPLVMAGTVTGEVLVWRSDTGEELHRLGGHDGVIFSVNYSGSKQIICSTSDDRSARVYQVTFTNLAESKYRSFGEWTSATVTFTHSLYGHVARVFRSLISDTTLMTVGEDGKVISWSLETGNKLKCCTANSGSAVWSLASVGEGEEVVTGGGNGSITRWDMGEAKEAIVLECGLSKPKVVKCVGERVLVMGDEGELVSYNKDRNISAHC